MKIKFAILIVLSSIILFTLSVSGNMMSTELGGPCCYEEYQKMIDEECKIKMEIGMCKCKEACVIGYTIFSAGCD